MATATPTSATEPSASDMPSREGTRVRVREHTDNGSPTVISEPDSSLAESYRKLAMNAAVQLSRQPKNRQAGLPKIVVQ